MLDQLLSLIRDPADYATALKLYKLDTPLSNEDMAELVELYRKYIHNAKFAPETEDLTYVKITLAVDLLSSRDNPNLDYLELGEENVNVLNTVKQIVIDGEYLTVDQMGTIAETVVDTNIHEGVRIMLARLSLDVAVVGRYFLQMKDSIIVLANFLAGRDPDMLARYTDLTGEVRYKCGN